MVKPSRRRRAVTTQTTRKASMPTEADVADRHLGREAAGSLGSVPSSGGVGAVGRRAARAAARAKDRARAPGIGGIRLVS